MDKHKNETSQDYENRLRSAAGKAYDKYQKCGLKGATKLFKAGW